MKNLITILCVTAALSVQAQTVKVATSTSATAPVVYTQAGTNNAIAKAINALPSIDTTGLLKVRDKVLVLQDPGIAILQNQAKSTASQITTLQAQTTSQQVQLNSQAGIIATLQAQLAALQIIIDKLKAALQ